MAAIRLIGPAPRPSSDEPIACQKTSRNSVPMLRNRTANTLIAMAAWVRLTRLDASSPSAPKPSAVTISTM